jgi:hypothetical protein
MLFGIGSVRQATSQANARRRAQFWQIEKMENSNFYHLLWF